MQYKDIADLFLGKLGTTAIVVCVPIPDTTIVLQNAESLVLASTLKIALVTYDGSLIGATYAPAIANDSVLLMFNVLDVTSYSKLNIILGPTDMLVAVGTSGTGDDHLHLSGCLL